MTLAAIFYVLEHQNNFQTIGYGSTIVFLKRGHIFIGLIILCNLVKILTQMNEK